MKLIIDIDDTIRDKIFDLANSGEDTSLGIINQMIKAIVNGIPLNDIKVEIEDFLDTQEQYDAGLKKALEIIDRHTEKERSE